jgi:hypothetical protein
MKKNFLSTMHDFFTCDIFSFLFLQQTFQELLIAFLISYSSLQQHLFFLPAKRMKEEKKERNEEQ